MLLLQACQAVATHSSDPCWWCLCRVATLLAVKYSRDSFEATQASEQSTVETKRRAFEVQRRMHPRTAADFALLNKASILACAAEKWAASVTATCSHAPLLSVC